MEILLKVVRFPVMDMFKIDLIVWKYVDFPCLDGTPSKFKIDLIVWKYRKISRKNRNTNRFKIDLIVWKLLMFFIHNIKYPSLK